MNARLKIRGKQVLMTEKTRLQVTAEHGLTSRQARFCKSARIILRIGIEACSEEELAFGNPRIYGEKSQNSG